MTQTSKAETGPLAEQVAARLRQIREAQRLTYVEVAARLERLGRPIPVIGLRRIERLERRVDVDDLTALAYALDVSPLSLLFPVERGGEVEALPDRPVDLSTAVGWFTGNAPLGKTTPEWSQGARPLNLLRRHEYLVLRWSELAREEFDWSCTPHSSPTDDDRNMWQRNRVANALRATREEMKGHGLTPPRLTGDLTLLENDKSGGTVGQTESRTP